MKKRMKRGSMTIEAALLMPLLLLVVTITLYLFFYVHNKVWLTAAAYEAALDGSLETARPEGKSRDKALKKGKELGNSGFYESKNLKLQVSEGKKVQVTYDLDMFSLYGGFNSHLQVKGSVKEKKQIHNTILDHPRKNLIIIIVESLNSWLLNRTIDGIEITPNLNRFIKEDST